MACLQSPQSAAMRHVFFAEREAAKIPDLAKDTRVRPIKSVAVIGAGTMGGGIAMNFAKAGIAVKLLELNPSALDRGLGIVAKNYNTSVKKGKLSASEASQAQSLISGTTDYDDLHEVDLVIEAVFEDP